jgi:hypothetical protein
VSEFDKDFPPEALRATGLRVEHRGGRLIVRSGPPRFLVGVLVAGLPSMVLLTTLLRSRRSEAEAAPALFM